MSKYDRDYLEEAKKLPTLLKEIQDIRNGIAEPLMTEKDKAEEIKVNRIFMVDQRFNAAGAIIGILFLILFVTSIHGNYIFATSEEEKIAINKFEVNENSIDIINTISSNISDLTKKEIVKREKDIEFEIIYVETEQLPKDEENVLQEGTLGKIEQNIIMTYENEELISENVLSESIILEPVEKIIEIGTSEFLLNNQVHIGDKMYTTKELEFYESNSNDEILGYIYENIDVIILSEKEGWANVRVDGYEGFVKSEFLTSENITPEIVEKSRIQRIKLNLNRDMKLNSPSGFSKEDFVKVLSSNQEDTNKIFERYAEVFYEVEQKYNINGIFLASMAIHESNWGTSTISVQKKNLFGYGSYDESAYTSSYTFESYEYGIELVAKVLVKYYLNEEGTEIYDNEIALATYYNGPTISGVNVRYASDPNWSTRIYEIMHSLYEKL